MRYVAGLLAILVLAACTSPGARDRSPASPPAHSPASELRATPVDPPVQDLLTHAAADFHAHAPPLPTRFRGVRIGHVLTSDGAKQYMLCGQFLPEQDSGEGEWTPFATIKTSPYEQWLGAQAVGLCQRSSIVWEKGDLSSALQSQLDSLRSKP